SHGRHARHRPLQSHADDRLLPEPPSTGAAIPWLANGPGHHGYSVKPGGSIHILRAPQRRVPPLEV
ncbi:unnamed protein product, partial [Symbiodinium sp. KB8]